MPQHEDLRACEEADERVIREYQSDPANIGYLDDALKRARFTRSDLDLRCEIGRRTMAALRQRAAKDFPGKTRRERWFPWAPDPPSPEELPQWEEELVGMGVSRVIARYVLGGSDQLPGMQYVRGLAPIVRQIRSAIERGDIERSRDLEERFEAVLCPYWRRVFEKNRAEFEGHWAPGDEVPSHQLAQEL